MELTEFAKQKIAFAVALLAAIFTLTPIIQPIGEFGFEIFQFKITVDTLYYTVATFLGLAVYSYGLQLINTNGMKGVVFAGNIFYAAGLVTPFLYIFLWIISWSAHLFSENISGLTLQIITSSLGVLVGIISAIVTAKIQFSLAEKDKQSLSEKLSREEIFFIQRAAALCRERQYDLAVIEAYKGIEVAARRLLYFRGRKILHGQWTAALLSMDVLPTQLSKDLTKMRNLRNGAAHSQRAITAAQAKKFTRVAERIVSIITDIADSDIEKGKQ